MPRIAYITNSPPQSGTGKPAREIARAACNLAGNKEQRTGNKEHQIDLFEIDGPGGTLAKNGAQMARVGRLPGPLGVKPAQWWRLSRYLPSTGYDLWHLTNQSLSFIRRAPAVVTVYDLIELLDPQERFGRATARFLYRRIPDAAHIICISAYTKKTVQEVYRIPEDRITIIPLGVSRTFVRLPGARESLAFHEFRREQKLFPDVRLVLYVGSEHPRKNLRVLLEAFARVRTALPNLVLLKVGDPGLPEGRARLLEDLDRLGLRDRVRLLKSVDEEGLRFLYSIADVFVFPSTFEGFGIPPLEAMACGCPVVCSNATSLPEVVGDAAILCDPQDVEAFATGIRRVLTEPALVAELRQKGLARVPQFFWEGIAAKTLGVYRRVLDILDT